MGPAADPPLGTALYARCFCSERVSPMPKAAIGTYKKLATLAADRGLDSQASSSLIPMLVSGLIMIVIGMLVVAAIS